MNDFIFGTLSTDELRRQRQLSSRNGVVHNHRINPRDPMPGQEILIEMTAGPAYTGEKGWLYWTNDGSDPSGCLGKAMNGFVLALRTDDMTWDNELWGYIRHFGVEIPGQMDGTILKYKLSLENHSGSEIFADEGITYAIFVSDDPAPAWSEDAIIYHIFIDRFNPGGGKTWNHPETLGGFFGGTIRGVTDKLTYIQESGFNTLWLSPIFPSPSHHGYDATDFYSIEPRLGTINDFKELVNSAHERQMRIILDFVPNHISYQHPIFQEALRNSNSPYTQWFTFNQWPEKYETFFGVKSLPQLNLHHPGARQYVIDAAKFWLEQGVDGFRLDYAIGPVQEFWAEFRKGTRAINPDCWTFGEVVDPPDMQRDFGGLLDGCLDFMLLEAIRQTIAFQTWSVPRFASFLDRHEAYFLEKFSRPSFLDNHDMNRFLWAAEGNLNKLKLASLCQFSLQGAPVVYYGTEVGLSQQRDVRQGTKGIPEESRQPMLWGESQNQELHNYYQNLCDARKEFDCLRKGRRETVFVDDHIIVYRRISEKNQALIILNIGASKKTYHSQGNMPQIVVKTGEVNLVQNRNHYVVNMEGRSGVILVID